MILHLLWDEKISGRIIRTYDEALHGKNTYLYWYRQDADRHFIPTSHPSVRVISPDAPMPEIDFSKVEKVVIHGLDEKKIGYYMENLPPHVPVYWILWGTELYNWLLTDRGYPIYYSDKPSVSHLGKILNILKRFGLNSKRTSLLQNMIDTRNVTMLCCKEEFSLFRKYYPRLTRHLKNEDRYFYYPVDEVLGKDLYNSSVSGNKILIGNSASYTNNHEYVFSFLKDIPLKGKEIVTPLSYSGSKEYIEKISREGTELFGESYQPLTDFLPLEEYNRLMAEAEVVIYGSWRQEAMGNIVVALYLGAKVFMSDKSPLAAYLRNQGYEIYSLEKITEEELHTPLPEEVKKRHRAMLAESNSRERLLSLTKEIFG